MTSGESNQTIATDQDRQKTTKTRSLAPQVPALLFTATLLVGLALILLLPIPAGPTALHVGDVAKQSVRSPASRDLRQPD